MGWGRRQVLESLLAAAAASVAAPRAARAQRRPINVTREAPVITRRTFDPRNPPSDMPKLTPPEAGVCDATFEFAVGVRYTLEQLGTGTVQLWLDGLDITTRLKMNIFTVEGAPPKLIAHEEGHREINEHYYRDAADTVRSAARPLIGRMFTGTGADRRAAEQSAMRDVTTAIEQAYMTRVRLAAAAANEKFDEITRHGTAAIDEDEAIAQAIGAGRAR